MKQRNREMCSKMPLSFDMLKAYMLYNINIIRQIYTEQILPSNRFCSNKFKLLLPITLGFLELCTQHMMEKHCYSSTSCCRPYTLWAFWA